jgi:hypothetical protein
MELFNDCIRLVEVLIRRVGFWGYIRIVSPNKLTSGGEYDKTKISHCGRNDRLAFLQLSFYDGSWKMCLEVIRPIVDYAPRERRIKLS